MKTAFVTGGTGFLGRNLTAFLLAEGWRVRCLVRSGSKYEHLKEMGAEILLGDFHTPEVLRDGVRGADAVFHLAGCIAAVSPEKMMEVNCTYTENLVKACAERAVPPVFIYVSSLAAAGPSSSKRPHVETDECKPVSNYGKSKLAAENMLRTYADRVPVTVIRPPMLFGPYDHEVRQWLQAIRKTGIFFIPMLRSFRFSMAHSEDVCSLLLLAAEHGERLPFSPAQKNGEKSTEKFEEERAEKSLPKDMTGIGIYYVSQTEHPTYMEMGPLFGKALRRKFTFILPTTPIILRIVCAWNEWRMTRTGRVKALNADKFREINAGSWSCSADKARKQLGFQNLHTLAQQCRLTAEWLISSEKR